MLLDLDSVIFVTFLVANLAVGLFFSKGIKTVKEYAIGDGTFSTSTITTTVIATYMGASFFSTAMTESYRQGLYFILPILGEPLALIITGWIFIPRMKEFIGHSSIAEVMGKFYGKYARVVTAICGMCFSAGICSLQFKIASQVLSIFFNISSFYTSAIAAFIIILYSGFGGIRAVTFTDILQFFTFTAVLPLIFIAIWQDIDQEQLSNVLSNNPSFDLDSIFDKHNPRFLSAVVFFLVLALHPLTTLDPAYSQRINMSKNITQAKTSFTIAGLVSFVLLMMICGTSVALFSNNANLDPNQLLPYIMNHYTFTGLKGLMAVCFMSLIMSTADSYMNSSSVLLANDIIGVLKPESAGSHHGLLYLRLSSLLVGVTAFVLSCNTSSLFEMMMITVNFYTPIVCAPLLLAMFGFYSSPRVVLMGMGAGVIGASLTMAFWKESWGLPGLIANLTVFILAHLITGKPRGFGKSGESEHKPATPALDFFNLRCMLKNFNFSGFLEKSAPRGKRHYISIILLSLSSLLMLTCTLTQSSRAEYNDIINITYFISLAILSAISTYTIFPFFNNRRYLIGGGWILSLGWLLVAAPSLFIYMHKFSHISLLVFVVNIITFVLLLPWQVSLPMAIIHTYASIKIFGLFIYSNFDPTINAAISTMQFKISCLLLPLGIAVLAFLKPKQEEQAQSEGMIDYLNDTLHYQQEEIDDLLTLKQTFLRNLQHETNTPVTGVYSMSQALGDCYDKLTDEQRKNAIATIVSSSERLISYVSNLVDVSKLTRASYGLKVRKVDLSNLAHECLRKCKKLYITKEAAEDREIILEIEPSLTAICHEYYIRKSFENLIVNAIQYCRKGKIIISLAKDAGKDALDFSIKDSGIGVPKEELITIFDPFVTSSKTTTPAGGRGMGLTLVKKVAEAHKGIVSAKSDGKTGSVFTLIIPANSHG